MLRRHRNLAVILAIGLTLAACGRPDAAENAPVSGSWSDVVAAAEREGAVTIYSTQVPQQLENLKKAFEAKYPKITVTVVRSEDTELIPRVETEHRTNRGIGDLYVSASRPWISGHTELFQAPRGPAFDAGEYDRKANVAEGNYFVVSAFVGAFAWNTKLFPGKINDWPDFLDPALGNGNIGVVKPDTASKVGFFKYIEERYGAEYLDKLAAQRPKIYPSAVPMANALTSGEIAAATFVEPMTRQQASGAPVEWSVGGQPWGVPFYGMLLGSAPHPNAAQLLADFAITREGQAAITPNAGSVLRDVPGAVTTTADLSMLDLGALTPDKIKEFQSTWEKLFVA
jgi:iron(III) transport system substrate-binding protein